jgi:DNA modification methylase
MPNDRATLRSSRGPAKDAPLKISQKELDCTLEFGDCRKLLAKLPERSVQTIITSPPYWGLRNYGVRGEIGAERKLETYLDHLATVFEESMRVVRRDGTLWIVIGDTYTSGNRSYRDSDSRHPVRAMAQRPRTPSGLKPKDLIGLPWRIALMIQALGWHLRTEIIWQKPNPLPESVKDRPHRAHEYIFLFSRSKNYLFDHSKLNCKQPSLLSIERSIWKVAAGKSQGGHSAGFPLDLIRPCVASSSVEGSLILDPFAGSGTVGVAALEAGRSFIGFDLNKAYIRAATARLESYVDRVKN